VTGPNRRGFTRRVDQQERINKIAGGKGREIRVCIDKVILILGGEGIRLNNTEEEN